MAWVVDTSVLLDIILPQAQHMGVSASCLSTYMPDGLCIFPISLVEVAPAFGGDFEAAIQFFEMLPIDCTQLWTAADTAAAHLLWHEYQVKRRQGMASKRPVADVLIAAFARRFQGVITRNSADFRNIDPELRIIVP